MKSLLKLLKSIEEIRKIEEEMPAQRIAILLLVAMREGLTYKDLMDYTGLANSTISRNVTAMSKKNRHGKPGTDLVEIREEPDGYHRKMVFLTPKGKRVVRSLQDHMED